MREFPYVTVGQILEQLENDGIKISRTTFYRLEKEGLFTSQKNIGNWRVYSPIDADIIVKLIKRNYGFKTDIED